MKLRGRFAAGLLALSLGLGLGPGFALAAPPKAPPLGRVLFVSGSVRLERHGKLLPVSGGLPLSASDILSTEADGKLQLRLADGAQISLAPLSRLQLAPPQVEGVALQLDAGAVRVLSMAPRAASAASAPTPLPATRPLTQLRTERVSANIRGAAFSANYNGDGSVNIATERDAIQVCTSAGCVDLNDEGAVRVRSDTMAPTPTNGRPTYR